MKDTMNRLTILAAGALAALGTRAADGVAVVRFDPNGGKLDVDIITPDNGIPAVENIVYKDAKTMKKGTR